MTKPEDIPQDVWNQAKRLVFDFPRPSVIESIARAIMAAKAEERKEIVYVCETLKGDFLAPGYAVNQPHGSFSERFAIDECIRAIRNRDTV